MKSPVVKRSIVIAGHKTSVSLEDAFWASLKDIAGTRNMTLSELVASIDADRRQGNLSSAIRLYRARSLPRTEREAERRKRRDDGHAPRLSAARRIGRRARSAVVEAAAGFARPQPRSAAAAAPVWWRPGAARYSAEAEALAPARQQAAADAAAGSRARAARVTPLP